MAAHPPKRPARGRGKRAAKGRAKPAASDQARRPTDDGSERAASVQAERLADEPHGLECRHCGCRHFRVIYTRPYRGGRVVRRRQCRHCGTRMTTWERAIGGG